MKRTSRLGVAVLTLASAIALLIGGGVPASGQSAGGDGTPREAIGRLKRDAVGAVTVSIDGATRHVGFARVARGGDLFPGSSSATPQGKARGFFARYGAVFGVGDADLIEVSRSRDAFGFTHVSYEQRYEGVPVFGGAIRAHLDRGNKLIAVNGTLVPNIDLDVDPLLSGTQAAQRAIADVRANPPVTDETADTGATAPTGLRAASSALTVYRMGLVRDVPGSNQLAYRVEVTNGADVREFVFVHANSGKIVNRYSGIHDDLFRRLFEENLDNQVWEEGDPFPGDLDEDQQNIVTFSGHSYHHFLHAFGRDSYDGEGHELQSVNNDPRINCPNANWNGATTNYCTGVTADDVVAHEWGHAYTEFTHGLIYQWQSGALNESYSDIWGELVDQINGAGTDAPGGTRTVGRCSTFTDNWPTVVVNQPDDLADCAAAPAQFGPELTATGVTGDVVLSQDSKGSPTDGCTNPTNGREIEGTIALVDRGTCTFTAKVVNMQRAGATGVMIANNIFGGPSSMPGVEPSIEIPSVMISRTAGAAVKQALGAGTVNVTMRARTGNQGSYRWLMGEDATAFDGAIRDMWNPNCLGDPGKVTDQEYFCSADDSGGVHSNSGVPNHGFALLVDGGTYNGQTISAIGLTKAAHLYWRAGSVYQTPSSDFADHADSLVASCTDLVGVRLNNLSTSEDPVRGSRPSMTAADCTEVAQVIDAVEFRTDPTAQCNFQPLLQPDAPPVCGDQPATELFLEDFESGLDGWTLTNQGVFEGWPDLNWTTDDSLPADRDGSAAFAADPDIGDCGQGADDVSGMMSMESPAVVVPGGTVRLSFTHYVSTELGWDGGNVKISVNGRAYSLIPPSAFVFNPYNTTLQPAAAGNTNPLAGQPGFSGTDAGELVSSWGMSIVDLAATGARIRAGDSVRFRFDFGMDGCTGIDGWYVDDVTVSACGAGVATKEEPAIA